MKLALKKPSPDRLLLSLRNLALSLAVFVLMAIVLYILIKSPA